LAQTSGLGMSSAAEEGFDGAGQREEA